MFDVNSDPKIKRMGKNTLIVRGTIEHFLDQYLYAAGCLKKKNVLNLVTFLFMSVSCYLLFC